MSLRGSRAFGLACLLALALASPASGWGTLEERDSPRGAIAACLRATGDGQALGLTGSPAGERLPYDLLGLNGLALRERIAPARLRTCPEIAATAGGPLVEAAIEDVRGVLRGRVNGQPADLDVVGRAPVRFAVASSPTGDALATWIQRRRDPGRRLASRLVVSRATLGGRFGQPEVLSSWLPTDASQTLRVAAAYDAVGRATIVWTPPTSRRTREVEELPPMRGTRVKALTAEPRMAFGRPQIIGRLPLQSTGLALAAAGDGRALVAYDGDSYVLSGVRLQVAERVSAAGGFEAVNLPAPPTNRTAGPAVALRPDGGAIVAWLDGYTPFDVAGVEIMVRPSGGAGFSRTSVATRRVTPGLGSSEPEFAGIEVPPSDEEALWPTVALSESGEYVIAWGAAIPLSFGDTPVTPRAVSGSLTAGPGPVTTLGCACRSVNGVRAVSTAAGPAVAFTDNVTDLMLGAEMPRRDGRLVVTAPDLAPASVSRPRLRVRAHPQTLGFGKPLILRAHCDGPCRLRAVALDHRDRRQPIALAMATLSAPGRATLRVRPSVFDNVAPRGGGRVPVLVRAYTLDGARFAQRVVRIRVRRARVQRLVSPRDVTARRADDAIVVTWRYPRYPTLLAFAVAGKDHRRDDALKPALGYETVVDRPYRPRRRVVLRPRRPERVRYVAVGVFRYGPFGSKTTIVRVTG